MEPDLTTSAGGTLPLDVALATLSTVIRGELVTEGHERYEELRRVWNATVDRRPVAIVLPSGVADIRAAIAFAQEQALPFAVRGGGHNVAGGAVVEGGVVVDLSSMRSVRIDPDRRVAHIEGGALLGDVDHEAQSFGLATPLGVVSATGVAGLTLHGGLGFLTRRFGLSCDNLLAADVVTADGRLVRASLEENSDLLWALRGGGGNFGVVTRFEMQLHPVGPEVDMVITMYPIDDAVEVATRFRALFAEAPPELMGVAVYWTTPEGEPVPEEHRGKPTAIAAACWSGAHEEAERWLAPLRSIATPYVDLSGRYPFLVAQTLFDPDFPPGQRHYWKSAFVPELSDALIATVVEQAAKRPSPMTSVDIWALGGAMLEEPPGGSAFAQREQPFLIAFEGNWIEPADDDANVAWGREAYRAVSRFSDGAVYLNFPGTDDERPEHIGATYSANLARLREVKAKYDPTNFFRSNINVAPAELTITMPPGVTTAAQTRA